MRRVVVMVVGAAMAFGGFAGTAAGSGDGHRDRAAGSPVQRWALNGSARYLVYAQIHSARPHGLGDGGDVYAKSRSGKRRHLGNFDATHTLSLAGSFLVQGHHSRVRWENLRTGQTGRAALPRGGTLKAAAPGGWIVSLRGAAPGTHSARHLVKIRSGGNRVELGTPFADGSPYALDPGPTGVVAWSSGDASTPGAARVRFMPWAHPNRWGTIFKAAPGSATLECGGTQATPSAVTGSYVACTVSGYKGRHRGLQALIPLSTGRRAVLSPANCIGSPVVLHSSEIWMGHADARRGCATGQLYRFSHTTTTSRVAGQYLPIDPVQALGGVIVQTSHAHLRLLAKASASPKQVV